MLLKLIAFACLALLPPNINPNPASVSLVLAQYHPQQQQQQQPQPQIGPANSNQPSYQMLRAQQQQHQLQPFNNQNQFQSPVGAAYQSAAEAPPFGHHHQKLANQFFSANPQSRQQQQLQLQLTNDQKPTIPLSNPQSPIPAHNVPNVLRPQNIPIISSSQGAPLTLNQVRQLSNNNMNNNNNINNNNNNNLGNINNINNNQQSHLLNQNRHGYTPLNAHHQQQQQQQQQQPTPINYPSPSVNNRPNIGPLNPINLLHSPMTQPRVSPAPPPMLINANDDQRNWNTNAINSNRMTSMLQSTNNINQELNVIAQNSNMRPLYQQQQQKPVQQSSNAATTAPVVSNQQQQQNHSIAHGEPATVTITHSAPQSASTPTSNNNNSVMKVISDDNAPEKKSTEQQQQQSTNSHTNDAAILPDENTKKTDPGTNSEFESPTTTAIALDKEENNTNKESINVNSGKNNSSAQRPSNTVLETSMPQLETTTASSNTTPWIDQSSQPSSYGQTPQPPSPSLTVSATTVSSTIEKQTEQISNWSPLDQSSRIGASSRNKTQLSSNTVGGVTLQPALEILTVSPDYNPDARNQSSYEVVVSQQMGAPTNLDQRNLFNRGSANETSLTKKKSDVNEAVQPNDSLDISTLVKPTSRFVQPTSTTTIIWSSTNSPPSTPVPALAPSTTVKSELYSPSSKKIEDAPVVYGKAHSQARPAAPVGTLGQSIGQNLSPSPVTGQASIETSVPAQGKPFIVPVDMDEVRPYASQHSGRSSIGANNHGIRHLPPAVRSGGGPVMQIGSGLTVTANDTKQNSGSRNLLPGFPHSDTPNHHSSSSTYPRQSVNALSSSFQVSGANEEAKNSGDSLGESGNFDLNGESSNDASTHSPSNPINNTANTGGHVVIRRPPFKPRTQPLVRIDTCVPNDENSCEKAHNERCIVEHGSSLCHCKPGYARTSTLRGPCILSVTYGVTLRADRISEKKLVFNNTLTDLNSTEYQYLEFESLQAIGTAFQSTKFAKLFMGAKVNNFTSTPKGKVLIHMTVNLESNRQTKSLQNIRRSTQEELLKVANSRQRNLGDSSLWLDNGSDAVSPLEDINECANKDLNDCSKNAICSNEVGTFQCECLPGYEDKSQGDSGRQCVGCSPNFCSNRGECHIIDGQKQCKCRGNFIGTRCDIDGEVMAVAVGGSLTALIIFIITFWCLYVYNQRWKQEQQKIDAMSATSGLTFSYVNSSTNNLISSAYNHHQDQGMITSASSSNGGLSGRSLNLSSSSHQTSPSNQSYSGGIVGIAGASNGTVYNGGHTMRGGANGGYTLSGHHLHGYGGAGGTTKSNYVAQLHAAHNGSSNNYRTLACDPRIGTQIYGVSQETMNGQLPPVKHEKSRMGNCYYLSPEMLVNQQHHHLYSSPQQRMLNSHSPTFDPSQYMADDRELCIDTSGATVGHLGGVTKRGGTSRNQSYHQQNLIFNQQQGGHHAQGRQGATLKSKSRSSQALNADRMGYNQMVINGGIYNETEFSSRDVYMPQYLMSE